MLESKIELTERLRREGRWKKASRFKETVLRECRGKGMKRSEASDAAWEAMATAYPPLDTETIPFVTASRDDEPDGEELLDLDDLAVGQPFAFARDVVWVYGHLDDRAMTPKDAPSRGCWALLEWARVNRNRFYETVLPKAARADDPDEKVESRPMAGKSIQELRDIITARMGPVGGPSGGD